jgi:multiple sugar transport system ATP-binding protein
MVRGPKVFLLDEPLSNLDAKLRTAMRAEIVKLHNQLKTTYIYVTHDQVEAMTMGTRIVVMKLGEVQQIDTPTNLFDYPENKFVAGFIGTPQMNFFEVDIKREKSKLSVTFNDGQIAEMDLSKLRTIEEKYLDGNTHRVYLGARSENIKLAESGIRTTLSIKEILGNTTQLFLRLEEKGSDVIVSVGERNSLAPGDVVYINFNEEFVHLFDKESEASIMSREYGNK